MAISKLGTEVQKQILELVSNDGNIDASIKDYIITHDITKIKLDNISISSFTPNLKAYIEKYEIDSAAMVQILQDDNQINYNVIAPIIAKAIIKKRLTFIYAYLTLIHKFRESETKCISANKESGELQTKYNALNKKYDSKVKSETELVELIKNMLDFHSSDSLITNLDSIGQ